MLRTTRLRPSHFLAGAISGVMLAHLAAYALVYPDAAVRTSALAEGDHGWIAAGWEKCSVPLVLVLVIAAAQVLTRRDATHSVSAAARRLAGVQCLGFGLLEIVERQGSTTPIHTIVTSPTFLIGLALQPLVAALIVGLVTVSEAVTARLCAHRPLDVGVPNVPESLPLSAAPTLRALLVDSTWSSRAPPVTA